jgi:hypothetical protein
MGYRSDVMSCIYGQADTMTAFMAKHKVMGNYIPHDFKKQITLNEYKGYKGELYKILTLKLTHFKWYEGHEDVDAWCDLLKEAGKVEGLDWEIVTVCEDGQTEENCSENAERHIYVQHSIEINY